MPLTFVIGLGTKQTFMEEITKLSRLVNRSWRDIMEMPLSWRNDLIRDISSSKKTKSRPLPDAIERMEAEQ